MMRILNFGFFMNRGHQASIRLTRRGRPLRAPAGLSVGSAPSSQRPATARIVIFRVDIEMHCITCVEQCTQIALNRSRNLFLRMESCRSPHLRRCLIHLQRLFPSAQTERGVLALISFESAGEQAKCEAAFWNSNAADSDTNSD